MKLDVLYNEIFCKGGFLYKKVYRPYKYNGKELQDELGLRMYDYGARNYDAAAGRWMNIHPLEGKYLKSSPCVYGANFSSSSF